MAAISGIVCPTASMVKSASYVPLPPARRAPLRTKDTNSVIQANVTGVMNTDSHR